MHRSPPRLFGFGVPLAGLIASVFGRADVAVPVVFAYLLVSVTSLGSADAFRSAAGKQLSTKKVMGSLLIAIMLVVAAAFGIILAMPHLKTLPFGLDIESAFFYLLAGASYTAVRCLEELFASQNDLLSARNTSIIACITLSAAMLIPGETAIYCGFSGVVWLLVGSVLAAGFSRKELPQLNLAIFREIPFALLRMVLYPALFLDAVWMLKLNSEDPALMCGFFAGLILIELAKSTARRDKNESAGLKIGISVGILLISLAVLALGCFWYGADLPLGVAAVLLAAACALVMYAPLDWETIAAIVILLAAAALTVVGIAPDFSPFPSEIFIGPAAGIVLCALMARQWAQLFRQRRANRIRKRAMKMSRS